LPVESSLLAAAGGIAGILFSVVATRTLVALAPQGQLPPPDQIGLDARVLTFALALSITTAILVGLWPAFRATNPRFATTLRDGGRSSTGATALRLRRVL